MAAVGEIPKRSASDFSTVLMSISWFWQCTLVTYDTVISGHVGERCTGALATIFVTSWESWTISKFKTYISKLQQCGETWAKPAQHVFIVCGCPCLGNPDQPWAVSSEEEIQDMRGPEVEGQRLGNRGTEAQMWDHLSVRALRSVRTVAGGNKESRKVRSDRQVSGTEHEEGLFRKF